MSEYLPKDVQAELAAARSLMRRRRATRSVHVGDEAFAVIEMSENGLAVDAAATPRLRGFIDIYEGPNHLYQALIVASERDGDLMRYDFKRNTAAMRTAPVDFEVDDPRPKGLLPKA